MKRVTLVVNLAGLALLATAIAGAGPTGVHARQVGRAGLVVRFGDESFVTSCVEFEEPSISGYDLLIHSDLDVVAVVGPGLGAAICDIENESGCTVDDCFCRLPDFWSYWHLVSNTWAYSGVGPSGYQVQNGDVDGWSWGTSTPPPAISFQQICFPTAVFLPLALRQA